METKAAPSMAFAHALRVASRLVRLVFLIPSVFFPLPAYLHTGLFLPDMLTYCVCVCVCVCVCLSITLSYLLSFPSLLKAELFHSCVPLLSQCSQSRQRRCSLSISIYIACSDTGVAGEIRNSHLDAYKQPYSSWPPL